MMTTRRALTILSLSFVSIFAIVDASFAQGKLSGRESAIRMVLIGATGVESATFANDAAQEFTLKSYFTGTAFEGKASAKALSDSAKRSGADAILLVRGEKSEINWTLFAVATGKRLADGVVDNRKRIQGRALAESVVAGVLQAIPFRGFVTKDLGNDRFEINLGTKHGIMQKQLLRLWDFTNDADTIFRSTRKVFGEVEVLSVTDSSAVVEAIDLKVKIPIFAKIGYDEIQRGMIAEKPLPARGAIRVAVGTTSFAGEAADTAYDNRVFRLGGTPSLNVGMKIGSITGSGQFVQGKTSEYDLNYVELRAHKLMHEWQTTFGRLGWTLGGQVHRIATSSKIPTVPVNSATRYGPTLGLQLENPLRGKLALLSGLEVEYPTFISGIGVSNVMFSYAINGSLGFRYEVSTNWVFDIGGNLRMARRPVEGQNSIQERKTDFFAGATFRF